MDARCLAIGLMVWAGCSESTPVRAFAGYDRTAIVGELVILEASKSAGDAKDYFWTLDSKPPSSTAELENRSSATAQLRVDAEGIFQVTLQVGASADTIRIEVANTPPVAHAGSDRSVAIGETIELDASGSFDPEGSALSFRWSLAAPAESAAMLEGSGARLATFTPDVEGMYVVSLVVGDGRLESAVDEALIEVGIAGARPVADAGPDITETAGRAVVLDGSNSSDADRDRLQYSWRVVSQPEGSAIELAGDNTARPRFIPRVVGTYRFELVVRDLLLAGAPDEVEVRAVADTTNIPVRAFDFLVIDAEYDRARNHIVAVSAAPPALRVLDPFDATGASDAILMLDRPPKCVAVSAGGGTAVVGHEGLITHVALDPLAIVATYSTAIPVFDVVTTDQFAYAIGEGSSISAIDGIRLDTGARLPGWSIFENTPAQLTRDGRTLLVASYTGPSVVDWHDVAGGVVGAPVAISSNQYDACIGLWLAEDETRVFTRCGNVFRIAEAPARDLPFAGLIRAPARIRHLDHSSAGGRIAFALDPPEEGQLGFADRVFVHLEDRLAFEREILMPVADTPAGAFTWDVSRVFFERGGGRISAILELEQRSGLAVF